MLTTYNDLNNGCDFKSLLLMYGSEALTPPFGICSLVTVNHTVIRTALAEQLLGCKKEKSLINELSLL